MHDRNCQERLMQPCEGLLLKLLGSRGGTDDRRPHQHWRGSESSLLELPSIPARGPPFPPTFLCQLCYMGAPVASGLPTGALTTIASDQGAHFIARVMPRGTPGPSHVATPPRAASLVKSPKGQQKLWVGVSNSRMHRFV